MSAARPLVSVINVGNPDAKKVQLPLPAVLVAPIRPDIVNDIHRAMNKNRRQAYGVKRRGQGDDAGMGFAAISWGTGRAVARVARVGGGGTSRSGQGAFANQCRGGRMFAPTRTWRKWHKRINTNQKRFAVASALAASALPSLVMARGHKIDHVAEVPCVVDNSVESIQKTKNAVKALIAAGAGQDVEKAKGSIKIRRGVGKMRNRRHVGRKGPLVVFNNDQGVVKAFRNLPGVELAHVSRLNLLQLAPGGHLGRFIIWTQDAFSALDKMWGSIKRESTTMKGYKLPRAQMSNSDLTRIINSDEIQSKVRPAQRRQTRAPIKKNPLKNLGAMVKLNPYSLSIRRSELLAAERKLKGKTDKVNKSRFGADTAAKKRRNAHRTQQNANYVRISSN